MEVALVQMNALVGNDERELRCIVILVAVSSASRELIVIEAVVEPSLGLNFRLIECRCRNRKTMVFWWFCGVSAVFCGVILDST